jgi:hypothetical protein
MARFVVGRSRERTFVALVVLILFATSLGHGQYTGIWIDATSPAYTNNAAGDMCKAINNAYLAAPFNAVIDARGFSGVQACNSPSFNNPNGTGNPKSVTLLLPQNATVVVSWPQWTPEYAHTVDGGNDGNDFGVGSIWALCGPNLSYWSSGSCSVIPNWYSLGVTVPQFPGKIQLGNITGTTTRSATCPLTCANLTPNQVIVVEKSSVSGDNGYQTLTPTGVTCTTTCTITWFNTAGASGTGTSALAFSGLVFSVPHAKFPASTSTVGTQPVGNYACAWCIGGQGATAGSGWNQIGLDYKIRNFRVDFGGNTNVFALYSMNTQEGSIWENVFAVDFPTDTNSTTPGNAAVFFADRTESPTGAGNFTIRGIHTGSYGMTGSCSNCWGGGFEHEDITVSFNAPSCSSVPTAWVTQVPNGPTFNAVIGNNGSGGCSTPPVPTCTVSGSPSSFGGNLVTTASCAVTVSLTFPFVINQVQISGGSGYNTGFLGGAMKYVGEMTLAGGGATTNCVNGTPKCLEGGIFGDGLSGGVYGEIHCEFLKGNCRDIGTENPMQGGTFLATDTSQTVAGYAVHLGKGADGTQLIQGTETFLGTSLILDDNNGVNNTTISTTACPIPTGSG